jgi:hypothetical protein
MQWFEFDPHSAAHCDNDNLPHRRDGNADNRAVDAIRNRSGQQRAEPDIDGAPECDCERGPIIAGRAAYGCGRGP